MKISVKGNGIQDCYSQIAERGDNNIKVFKKSEIFRIDFKKNVELKNTTNRTDACFGSKLQSVLVGTNTEILKKIQNVFIGQLAFYSRTFETKIVEPYFKNIELLEEYNSFKTHFFSFKYMDTTKYIFEF